MDYSNYISPFSFRYGSDRMRQIFSEENKFKIWRKIWVSLAKAESKYGLVSKAELADLERNQDKINIARIQEIEKETRHDVVAAIREFAEVAKIGGGKIHLGATSMDVVDNCDSIRVAEALDLVEKQLVTLIKTFGKKVDKYSDFACMGYTHLQAAEPTTLGYRFAFYAQDLLIDLELLRFVKKNLKAKGMKGAVGTGASYVSLLDQKGAEDVNDLVMKDLGLRDCDIVNQTNPRKIDLLVSNFLASVAQSLNKFAFDLRIMQSANFGEWQEPFGKSQVGSSAMPFKRNPIKSEQICSLARLVVNLSRTAWDNAAYMLLERTLDDSANRRISTPEMFLAIDEMLNSSINIVDGLLINEQVIRKNLEYFWLFSASELIIVESVKKGADRQKMHELLREISMEAWKQMHQGDKNPMSDLLMDNKEIKQYLDSKKITELLEVKSHIGNASSRCRLLLKKINKA